MYNFRTDLALERRDIYKKVNKLNEIDGVESIEKEINEKIKLSKVKITNKNGEEAIGKPIGNYITIDVKGLKLADDDEIKKISDVLSNELKEMLNIHVNKQEDILIVGLGNIYVTPDALGPKVINEIDVTRHLIKYLPQYVEEGTRPVSAIAPGVLGTTGIDHHIYWRKKYLHIEPCGKKEEKAFNKYLSTRNLEVPKSDEYITGIYLKRQVNVVKYDTTDVDENQRVDYCVAKQEESKIKNQILCNK